MEHAHILPLLGLAAFAAGFVDAVAGGGGLIQLPALLVLMPTIPIPTLFGSNKFSSICGTSVALCRYTRSVVIPWRLALPAAFIAFAFSMLGARALTAFPTHYLRPVIVALFVGIAIHTFRHRSLGTDAESTSSPSAGSLALWFACAGIGFYDGFFGPGTGQFLILALVTLASMNFLHATASAKVVNFATNLAAVIYFGSRGEILFSIALPMAACNILGGWMGARAAILKGSPFIRRVFLGVVMLLIAKLTFDMLSPLF